MEYHICYELVKNDDIFTCDSCKCMNRIKYHKKYLLGSIQDPHCMNCMAAISYNIFLQKFNSAWVFTKYKDFRYDVLFNRDKSSLPAMVEYTIGSKKRQIM